MEIVVCLSRDRTFFSNMTYLADGGGFTHASLGLDPNAEYYYSFNFKGMKKEYRSSLQKRPREMKRYILSVPNEAGKRLKEILADMEEQKEKYQYAKLGVYLRLFNLPNEKPADDKYFCSQFVAAVLKASGCVDINRPPEECTPNDLLQELEASGRICAVENEGDLVNPGEAAIDKAMLQAEKGHEKLNRAVADNISQLLEGEGKLLPTLAMHLGKKKLDPLYEKMMDKLDLAGDAVGEGPEKLAGLTSGLLKSGARKLLDAKDRVDKNLRQIPPGGDKP